MPDLSTTFVGLRLRNPVIVSSAGITENVEKMRRCQDNGAAAVVMKSYFEEEVCRRDPSPRYRLIRHAMGREETFTFFSYEQASKWDIDRYAEELARAKRELEIKVFPSINCVTTEGWIEAARKVAAAGADAIELNTSCPHGSITFRGGAVEETIFESVTAVRGAVEVPLIAKISPMLTSPPGVVERLRQIGVDAVTIFNRMTGLEIDTETESPVMHGGYAGHGGPWAIQYPLRWISEIAPKGRIQIAGSGGVTTAQDVVKYILAGAQVVQVCTAVVLNGYAVIGELVRGLEEWMASKGYPDLASFRGKAARRILGTHEVERTRKFTAFILGETHAPCVHACPMHVPVQAYVDRIARRDFAGALEAIRSANPFQSVCGWVCYHPCETECTRALIDEPIAIRALKRFVIEWGRRNAPLSSAPIQKAEPTGKSVAVVGAGPAGLTAAYELARLGHAVTVLEASESPGGMLRRAIPVYRLPREIVDEEIAFVRRMGVEIRCGCRLGRDVSLDELCRRHDGVVLALGAGESARLGIEGEDADGVVSAMELLGRMAGGSPSQVGRRVAVVGGGGTALDAAGCALRAGAEEVYLLYRRSRAEMPIASEYVKEAEEEGVRIITAAVPLRIETDGGRVAGIRVRGGYLDRPRPGRRRALVPVEDIEYVLRVDQIVVATSQLPDAGAVGARDGVEFTSDGSIRALDGFGATSRPGVFAAGDATGESGSVIEAIASGRRAALGVHCHLCGGAPDEAARPWGESRPVDRHGVVARNADREAAPRVEVPMRDPGKRARDFEPIELTLSEEDAVREAQRCLRCGCGVGCELCYRICPDGAVLPDGFTFRVDEDKCTGCGLCIERCPLSNIEAVHIEGA